MTDREALEKIARIVRSGEDAIHARWQVAAVVDEIFGPVTGTPFAEGTRGKGQS